MQKRRRTSYRGWVRTGLAGAGRLVRTALRHKIAQSYTKTQQKRKVSRYTGGVTQQYDSRKVYQRKRMPRRQKRQWVRFVKKFNAALEKSLGTRTLIFNHLQRQQIASDQNLKQIVGSCCLYGGVSAGTDTSRLGYDDLDQIIAQLSPTSNQMVQLNTKSAVLDITFTNANSCVMELDVYRMIMRGTGQSTDNDILDVYARNETNMGAKLLDSIPNYTDRGWTPFDNPAAISDGKIKIMNKRKYLIGAGQVATYQVRDPRHHRFARQDIVDDGQFNLRGHTQIILWVAKLAPGCDDDDMTMYAGVTRKYVAYFNEVSSSRIGYQASTNVSP